MSKAMQIKPMKIWAILDPERYIKKSIKDWSLAIYDEKKSANRQIQSVSEANNEECFIEELELCSKLELDKYIELHNEMYEMLEKLIGNYQVAASVAEHEGYETNYEQDKILVDFLLAKARGEI